MPAKSDMMFSSGAVPLIESVHGETIVVMTGRFTGKSLIAVKEIEQDQILDGDLGIDPRAKRILRFRQPVPDFSAQDIVKTEDGKQWYMVRRPDSAFLTVDYELTEIAAKDAR